MPPDERPSMTRTTLNFWLDLLSLLVMIGLATTGGLIHFVLPPGTGHFHLLFGLGRHDFGQIHFYFALAAVALLALHVLLHWSWICCVVGKVLGNAVPSRRAQVAWGLLLLCGVAVFLVAGLWWASSRVQRNAMPVEGPDRAVAAAQRGSDGSPEVESAHEEDPKKDIPNAQAGEAFVPSQTPLGEERRDREKQPEDCPAGATIDGRTTLLEAAKTSGLSVEQLKERLKLPAGVDDGARIGRLRRQYGFAIHDVRKLACQ
jgi:hypothetical protein